MTPVIFINCAQHPFIEQIVNGTKQFETRNSDTLGRFAGQRVLLAETGKHGKPIVKASAIIHTAITVTNPWIWESLFYRELACIPKGSKYDWKPKTTAKYCYSFSDIEKVEPFTPDGKRHGRVWMEHNAWRCE